MTQKGAGANPRNHDAVTLRKMTCKNDRKRFDVDGWDLQKMIQKGAGANRRNHDTMTLRKMTWENDQKRSDSEGWDLQKMNKKERVQIQEITML